MAESGFQLPVVLPSALKATNLSGHAAYVFVLVDLAVLNGGSINRERVADGTPRALFCPMDESHLNALLYVATWDIPPSVRLIAASTGVLEKGIS